MTQQNPSAAIDFLHYSHSLPLNHKEDCYIVGMNSDGMIYVDELYGAGDQIARYVFQLDGTLAASGDENDGHLPEVPSNLVEPARIPAGHPLKFSGARRRGMRDADRILDWVYPISMSEKIDLSTGLNIPPPRIIGLAESVVLAEARLNETGMSLVCRRLRIAHMLPEMKYDDQHLPYNYDTVSLYAAQYYAATEEIGLLTLTSRLPGIQLNRPMDCMVWQKWLLVADGGTQDIKAAVHIWEIDEIIQSERTGNDES
jgi:hypothetical protein